MRQASIHFVTALPMEARAIRRELAQAGFDLISVTAVGIRAGRLGEMPSVTEGSTIVVAGLAGGLDPQLRVGDVVLDAPDTVGTLAGTIRGRIHTETAMVDSVDRKSSLFVATGAVAVDMEQAVVAAWAAEHRCVVIGLRGISDSASDPLDPILLTLVDDRGRPKPVAIVKALLRRPGRIVSLLRLARRSRLALDNLSTAAVELARQWV